LKAKNKDVITFPIKLDSNLHQNLSIVALFTNKSKHQYILDAVAEKVQQDLQKLKGE
jgi:predicted transcriptional regulator